MEIKVVYSGAPVPSDKVHSIKKVYQIGLKASAGLVRFNAK